MKGLRVPPSRTKLEPWLEPWPGKREGRLYLEGCRRMVDQLAKVIAVREEREYEAAVMAWESDGARCLEEWITREVER